MKTFMNDNALTTMAHLEEFLPGTQPITFSVLRTKDECDQWIQAILIKFQYLILSRPHKGLASISLGYLYHLWQATGYLRQRRSVEKTRPTRSSMGELRKPYPSRPPGFLRIDTLHQGDCDNKKEVYHIDAVNKVTPFQVVSIVEKINAVSLFPALEPLLAAFPFLIRRLHSDNGSEYTNRQVAALLGKLLMAFTKSHARQTNDHALVESHNGTVVRKLFGHGHFSQC